MRKRLTALLLTAMMLLLPLCASASAFDIKHTIAYMDSCFTCGCSRGGTGTMISRYGLITAAHNLYCPTHAKPLKSCNFYFGAKSAGSCWYAYSGKFTYRVYDTFQNGYSSKNDIGYVVFDTPVGDETGWCASWAANDHDVHQEYMNVYAYDETRHLESVFSIQFMLDSTRIYWDEWISGTDGGPVTFWWEGMEYPTVVAVYTSHDAQGNGYGRRLTDEIFRDMRLDGAFD